MTSPEVTRFLESMRDGFGFWHVDGYFLVQKTGEEIQKNLMAAGLDNIISPELFRVFSEDEITRIMYDEVYADTNGVMVFPSRRIVLGHTLEHIDVPLDRRYRMRDHFIHSPTWRELPLTTNLGAPLIQSGALGPQTYEIYNESSEDLAVRVSNLVCQVDMFRYDSPAMNGRTRTYGVQKRGDIRLGNPYEDMIYTTQR